MSQKIDSDRRDMGGYYVYADPLEKTKFDELLSTCNKLNFSDGLKQEVEWIARFLRDFERSGKPALRSAGTRYTTLQNIERLSKELLSNLDEIPNEDIGSLTSEALALQASEFPEQKSLDPDTPYRENLNAVETIIQLTWLSRAAAVLIAKTSDNGTKGGRPKVLPTYAFHLKKLADALLAVGIKPGRGGDFELVANAVFSAANVPSNAEGSIRHFLNMQPE